jgi:hypothetical protein
MVSGMNKAVTRGNLTAEEGREAVRLPSGTRFSGRRRGARIKPKGASEMYTALPFTAGSLPLPGAALPTYRCHQKIVISSNR